MSWTLKVECQGMDRESENVRRYFASKLPDLRSRGNQGTAHCPFHADRYPSLSVDAERGLFFCHSLECGAKGNLEQFERRLSKCSPTIAKKRIAKLAHRGGGSNLRPRIVTVYSYKDENGRLRYQQVRFEPKDFRFRRPDEHGGWIWNLQGVSKILYRLREVIEAEEVFIVEREKDVEALRAWGFVATCNAGGAGKWDEKYSQFFKGKKVVVLQDDDEPGRKHAQTVARSVAPYAAEVRLVPPFDNAKDVSEWAEHGGTKKQLRQLVKNTKPFEPNGPAASTPVDESTMAPDDWRAKPLRGSWTVALPETFFLDHLVLPSGIPLVASLWTIGTHIFEIFDCFPYLTITSPTKRCGKTRFAEILELLCARPLMSVNISEAALFRSIESEKPTVIIDEAEALRNKESERTQSLLAILQSGFKQGACVPRCVGRGFEVKKFSVFCPKAILAIGSLPDTLMDRSVVISMRRHLKTEQVACFRRRRASQHAAGILHTVAAWADKNKEQVAKAYLSQNLDFLKDREADIWEPLFAIASVAVPERLDELKQIVTRLSSEKAKSDVDDSAGIRLLADLRVIFANSRKLGFPTEQLIFKLKALPESRWEELTPVKLARLLRPYGISPGQLWTGETSVRGYDAKDFETVFDRYVPAGEPLEELEGE
jgi:hypothetical protein